MTFLIKTNQMVLTKLRWFTTSCYWSCNETGVNGSFFFVYQTTEANTCCFSAHSATGENESTQCNRTRLIPAIKPRYHIWITINCPLIPWVSHPRPRTFKQLLVILDVTGTVSVFLKRRSEDDHGPRHKGGKMMIHYNCIHKWTKRQRFGIISVIKDSKSKNLIRRGSEVGSGAFRVQTQQRRTTGRDHESTTISPSCLVPNKSFCLSEVCEYTLKQSLWIWITD